MDEQSIFLEALAIESPDDRAAFLDQACAGNDALRASVEALLAAHARASGFLAKPAVELAETVARPMVETAGSQIGPYKLMEKIGEGGFGQVFVAEQQQPVRRKVALKIIKPGMDTREVIARFEAERQALALMDHPNIAKVLDAGSTDTGRPFFVMELVRGVSITDYCDQTRLNSRERLELFVDVCQAVQHAHQKGIIHRDIKPSNVLVSLHDGRPVAKVIDFGVAKAINQQLTDNTVYTKFTQLIGTPLYMSPEQAEMSGLDIDTRTDVYSLGVLLYELLTGNTPFDKRRMAKAAFDEIRRIIREEEPPKPSTRLSESGDALPSIAAKRHTEPAKLSKLLRGDLDWIVMKALEKDRTRRYETANGFARDVQRYLADEPVEACPPSTGYRLRKFARKNRAVIVTSAAFALLLIAGTALSSWQAVRATRAQRLADERRVEVEAANAATNKALDETKQAKNAADVALVKSEQERETAKAVTEYLVEIFRRSDPGEDGREVKVADAFDRARQELDDKFAKTPAIKGRLLHAIGVTYLGLGLTEKAYDTLNDARRALEQSLGPNDSATLHCLCDLTVATGAKGQSRQAKELASQVYERCLQALGPRDKQTLVSIGNLASAERDDGFLNEAQDRLEKALVPMREVFGADSEYVVQCMNNLAHVYLDNNRVKDGVELLEQALALSKARPPANSPQTLAIMSNLAVAYGKDKQPQRAHEMSEAALEIRRETLGQFHHETLLNQHNLAGFEIDIGNREKGVQMLKSTLKEMQFHLPSGHPHTLLCMHNLGLAYRVMGDVDEAISLSEEVLRLRSKVRSPNHPEIIDSMRVLASAYVIKGSSTKDDGLVGKGIDLYESALKMTESRYGDDTAVIIPSLDPLVLSYHLAGRIDDATTGAERLLKLCRRHLKPGDMMTLNVTNALADIYKQHNRLADALIIMQELIDKDCKSGRMPNVQVAMLLIRLGEFQMANRLFAEAERTYEQCLVIREKELPNDWRTYYARVMLGAAKLRQKKYVDAVPLLASGYEEMQLRRLFIPLEHQWRVGEALGYLVEAKEANGDKDVAQLKAELEKIAPTPPKAPEPSP